LLFKKVEQGITYAEKILAGIGGFFFVILMLLGAGDVIGRYVFNKPIMGALEISEVLMAGVILFGWAYALKTGSHVRVELVISHYPSRVRVIAEFVTSLVSLGLFCLITWRSTLLALQYVQEHRIFPTLGFPIAPFYFFVPLGAFFLCLEFIIRMIYLIPEMRKGS